MTNKICKICKKSFQAKHNLILYCSDECRKKGLCQNTKNYSIRKDNKCVDCGILIGFDKTRCRRCSAKFRVKRGDTFGFYKGHKYRRTPEGIEKAILLLKLLGKKKKGITTDTSHLKQYQFKKGQKVWNKGITGYKLKERNWSEEAKKKHALSVSKATRGKPRLDKRGINSNFWKGGVSSERIKVYSSYKYREWRRQVCERDNYTCLYCGQKGGYLEAHHIKSFSDNKELRFDINNGITMCKKCHYLTENYGGKSNSKETKMPTPQLNETESEFMARCVPQLINEGKPEDQAVAQCLSMYKNRKE